MDIDGDRDCDCDCDDDGNGVDRVSEFDANANG